MSLTISKAEGVTVFTVTSNSKSKWPLCCQILGTMCYSPVCSVSLRLKQHLGSALKALATIQIMVGIMNLGYWILSIACGMISNFSPVQLGLAVVIAAIGVMGILAEKFPSPCLVVLSVVMNIVSAALAITSIVLYSVDLAWRPSRYLCRPPENYQSGMYYWTTPSPSKRAEQEKIFKMNQADYLACQENVHILQTITEALAIMMIVMAVLQLCVNISWCVLNIKALCKKKADGQEVVDTELCKPLMEEEVVPNPVC